ncbi:MAG: iron-containing alcohol dehydrogenase [Candidatus Bathyarchaeia archaeon]
MPVRVMFGECLGQIGAVAAEFGATKILIVTGRRAMKEHGVVERLIDLLKPVEAEVFDEVESNPAMETFERAYRTLKDKGCDLVIGLGGGSPMDVAKAAAAMGNKAQGPVDLFATSTQLTGEGLPMIAVPTTSGTGSEVTPFSIVSDPEHGTKRAANNPYLYPDVALVDPSLCKTMPRKVTAETGLDAISHAIESYWARRSQPITDSLALEALRHLLPNLRRACEEPLNMEARSEMALGALLAGMALSNTMATAAHSISYPLTVRFGIPHGLACALTLPAFIRFNAPSIPDKIPRLLQTMGVNSVGEAAESLVRLMMDIGEPVRLSDLRIGRDDIPWIVKHGFSAARVANNPREVDERVVDEILREVY